MPSGAIPKLNLRTLILLFTSLAILATLLNDLYATYRIQRETLVRNSLETNRAYAAKVALTLGQSLDADLGRLRYSAQVMGKDFASRATMQAEARRLAEQDQSFNTLVIADAQGRILASHPPALSVAGQNLRSREPLERRQAMISPAFNSLVGNLIVFVSHPIRSPQGEYLGLVGGTIYLRKNNALNEIVSKHFQTDASHLYLVDGNRHLLFHPDADHIGKAVGRNAAVDAVLRGESGAMQVTDADRVQMLAGYAPVPNSGWGVVVQQPMSVPLAALRALMLQVVQGIVPMILLGLVLLWWAASRISQPLSRLADYAEQLDDSRGIGQVSAWYYEAWRIRRALIQGALLTQERIGKLNHQVLSDPLTGLANRRMLEDCLRDWALLEKPFAVISMDIDHFKRVNDQYGHDVGDKVLQAFAGLLRQNCRDGDVPCRVGGEEFILLLPLTGLTDAAEVAERIRRSLAEAVMPPAGQVTLSLGVACWTADRPDVAATLKEADELLYQAKQAGRNRVMVHGKGTSTTAA
ncbi:GGDEF domain-containing protein [Pseudomonas citronellolis]|uniref:GGDEF domain-containing protein n=1 Tax=Pseudomonas citronellolis TaxID=53408 RepID=UPI0021C1A023|nr:sensor domain-containing diguanylate cyclase [Pseudomonas citronellolis]UXJ49846.1 sensor domain-containing diguanylate cyclase [Pseudomonas citronellolis]